ncbi:MAG: secretin N-terminal domain-containing protein [Acidobacteriota bacterium]
MGVRSRKIPALALVVLGAFLASGCAVQKAFRSAEKAARAHQWDRAVIEYSKAATLKPSNARYRLSLARAKLRAGQAHFEKGRKLLAAGQLELAIAELQQTVLLDPSNQYAANELRRALEQFEKRRASAGDLDSLKDKVRREGMEIPKLHPGSNIPIVLKFKEEPIGKIYDALSKASGINFLFDERIDLAKKITIDVSDIIFEKALEILMLQNKHFFTVWDENTLIIADDSRQKRQEYEDLVIQTFYLSNAEVKEMQTLLRTLLDARQVVQNDKLNAITIRDTPDRVAVAERIIRLNDKAKAELIIDIHLLELNRNTLRTLGIDLTSKSLGISFSGAEEGLPLNNLDLLKQKGSWLVGPIPGVLVNFLMSDADARVLAKPQLRVSEGEKATVRIGDRVPIPTTTFNTAGAIGAGIVPITSFTYQNVGINIDIEPRVHHNKEITLKLRVEVSSLSGVVSAGVGISQPIIGTREIETVIRLKDGETSLLAGLIREEERHSLTSVPGLGNIPGLRHLFGNNDHSYQETDIILAVTPHIIRIADIREDDLRALWIGTESNIRLRGKEASAFGPTPFDFAAGGTAYPPVPTEEEEQEGESPAGSAVIPVGAAAVDSAVDAERGEGPSPDEGAADTGTAARGGEPSATGGPGPDADVPPEIVEPGPVEDAEPALVRLDCPNGTVNETIQVFIRVFKAKGVRSLPFHLQFDPEILQYEGASEGNFMSLGGAKTTFLHSVSSSNPGEVFVGISRMGQDEGSAGSGILGKFNFRALAPGTTPIRFSEQTVLGANNTPLPANFQDCTVTVQ